MADQNQHNPRRQAASTRTTGRRTLQQQQRAEQGTQRLLPVVATPRAMVPYEAPPPATTGEKIKYTAVSGISTGALAGLLGMHSFSAFLAIGAGLTAWTLADEIRAKLQGGRNADQERRFPNWMTWEWWNTPLTTPAAGKIAAPVAGKIAAPAAKNTLPVSTSDDTDELEDEEDVAPIDAHAEVQEEEEDLLLTLGRVMQTRRRFDPSMNDVLGKGMIIMGSQGTGKSNLVGLIAQCAGDRNLDVSMPLLIIDYKGEFSTLCTVLANGIIAGHPSYVQEVVHGGFFPLTIEEAPHLAMIMMEGPFQVILDTTTYNGDNDQVAQVIAALLHSLMDWSREMRRAEKDPWPCLVITDEAHNFLPQKQTLSALAMERPKESFGALTSAYSRMANTGRSYGYTLIMATQRLPNIAKWAIANLQVKIVLAHAEKNDLDACEEECGGMVDREEIKGLQRGTGMVIGFTKEPVMVKFDQQKARHVSNTPQIKDVRTRFKNAPRPRISRALAQLPSQLPVKSQLQSQAAPAFSEEREEPRAMTPWRPVEQQQPEMPARRLYPVFASAEEPDQVVEGDPPEDVLEAEDVHQQVEAPAPAPRKSQLSDSDLARAFAYHQQGHNSYRKLYRYAKPRHGWSEQKCRDLMELMRERELIEQQGEDREQM